MLLEAQVDSARRPGLHRAIEESVRADVLGLTIGWIASLIDRWRSFARCPCQFEGAKRRLIRLAHSLGRQLNLTAAAALVRGFGSTFNTTTLRRVQA